MPGIDAWRAWVDGARTWFVSARDVSEAAGRAVLAEFYDADGRFVSAGVWRQEHTDQWVLEAPVVEARGAISQPPRKRPDFVSRNGGGWVRWIAAKKKT